ncbi:hypothetical protein B0H10DRAFT_1951853 [Mycena sp. CBHHK59/15]|nr:hypothetical protein B0H10DRAFT_1951853 [Mycena sp. CBHHK59/15]
MYIFNIGILDDGTLSETEPRFQEANGKEKAHDSEVSSGTEGRLNGTDGLDPDEIHGDCKGKGKAKVSQWSHSFEFFEDVDAEPVSSEHLQVHRQSQSQRTPLG